MSGADPRSDDARRGADYSATVRFLGRLAGPLRIFSLRCPKERRKAIVSLTNDGDDAGDKGRPPILI